MVRRAGMLVVGVLALCCPAARAGTYDVWSCADAGGNPVVADGWTAEGGAQFSPTSNSCGSRGGALFAGLNGDFDHPVGTNIAWHFTAPANTKIARYRLWRAATVDTNETFRTPLYTLNRGKNVYDGPYVVEQCPAYGCHALGSTSAPFGDPNLVTESGLADIRDLWLNASCGGGAGYSCAAAAGSAPYTAAFWLFRAQITLEDAADPLYTTPPSGSLTSGNVLTGAQGLSFSASDVGGGIARYEIEVDGHTVAQQVVCSTPYTAIVPCKPAVSGSLSFDTSTLTDGPHSARVLVGDAGGNTAAFGPFTITTANAPTSCGGEPGGPAVAFDRKRATIAYGGKLNVIGQAPPGAQVRVFSRVARGGAPERLGRTPLVADAAGTFTYKVPAGPSRALRFAYRSGTNPFFSCSKALAVAVKARSTLHASPRTIRSGRRVRFTGQLRGGYVPKGGKLVELQAYERGRWRSITTLRTNAKGAFSYRYRFSFRARGVTFPVRVRVRHDDSYPFALGTSAHVKVRVR